jgi:hypothetical protein
LVTLAQTSPSISLAEVVGKFNVLPQASGLLTLKGTGSYESAQVLQTWNHRRLAVRVGTIVAQARMWTTAVVAATFEMSLVLIVRDTSPSC